MNSSLASTLRFYKEKPEYIKSDFLSGTVVALALIPEAIAFSIIAGVDPAVGLYASFCIAVVIAIAGGRPAMISAATGAMAIVIADLVKDHGVQYLLAATILTGIFQVIAGFLGLARALNFVSKSVMTGFVNALAIIIFMAQLPELFGPSFTLMGWPVYAMVAVGLVIIYGLPYITKSVPSPLIAIILLTLGSWIIDFEFNTVGKMGAFPTSLPDFIVPNIPLTFETLKIITPYALTLTAVGLLESLMTAVIVDDLTDTDSNKNIECKGQGIANIVAGFFGGMAGCAMIGQSVINVKSGGRGRLSTLWSGIFLMILILLLDDYVRDIPMPALVAVMIMVSIGTFDFKSITEFHKIPKQSSMVMISTVIVTILTHDLAQGVLVGVLLSALNFAFKVSYLFRIDSSLSEDKKHRTYHVYGQVFFASSQFFIQKFNFKEVLNEVTINMSHAHFWDQTGVAALDKVVMKFRREGCNVHIIGMNEATRTIIDRYALYNKEGLEDIIPLH
ncbi:MAG: SulP family inorganic anion transporter [Pseudomonadota bacterium]